MKQKLMLIALSLMLILSLAACSSAEPAAATAPETASESAADTEASADTDEEKGPRLDGETPASTQLLMGTFMLEETDLAVDATQASELLPLWKAVRSLSNSDTASSVELDALYNQIQDLMTAEQLDQIASVEIGPDSMQTLMDELGLDMAMGRGNADDSESGTNMRPGGGQGGVPGVGREGMTDEQRAMMESMSDEERATAMAERGGGGMNPMNTMLLDPLIELLEGKAAS